MELPVLQERVDAARRAGARGCEMLLVAHEGVALSAAGSTLLHREESASTELRVTTWLAGGRRGMATGDPDDVDGLVERALAAAETAPEDAFGGPVDRLRPVVGGLGIEDRRHRQLTDEDRLEVVQEAERSVRRESKALATRPFQYRDRATLRRFANSRGVTLEERSTRYDASGRVQVGDIELTEHIASRSFASIASLPFGTTMARRAVALMQDGDTLDGEVHAMLPPAVVAEILAALGDAFVAARFTGELPFFLAPQGDAPVIDTRLHLLDDGRAPGGLRTRSFDDRGVVPVPLTLIREGVPDACLRGPEEARAQGVTPSGHVVDGTLRAGNLIMRGGTRSMNATYTDHGDWSLRVDALDLSDLDLATGVLDTVIDGLVMHSNVQKGSVRRRKATFDLGRMLNDLVELCSDTDRIRHVDAPALFVRGLVLH